MQPTSNTGETELQKAINNITSTGAVGLASEDPAVAAEKPVVEESPAPDPADEVIPVPAFMSQAAMVAPDLAAPSAMPNLSSVGNIGAESTMGDSSSLEEIKTRALTDLRPLIDKVDLAPEAKFKVYKEIILSTNDKAVIESAYEVAKSISAEKDRAEALLFIIEMIDTLGSGS